MKITGSYYWLDLRTGNVEPGTAILTVCEQANDPPDRCVDIVLTHQAIREIYAEVDFYAQEQWELDQLERSEP